MHEVVIGDGRTIEYKDEFSLLDTFEVNEIEATYNCRAGFCGVCKVKLLSGTVKLVQEPLMPTSNGEILSCCCIPSSDIVLDLERGI